VAISMQTFMLLRAAIQLVRDELYGEDSLIGFKDENMRNRAKETIIFYSFDKTNNPVITI